MLEVNDRITSKRVVDCFYLDKFGTYYGKAVLSEIVFNESALLWCVEQELNTDDGIKEFTALYHSRTDADAIHKKSIWRIRRFAADKIRKEVDKDLIEATLAMKD